MTVEGTKMINRVMLAGASLLGVASAAHAQTVVSASIGTSANVGYSTNPFLSGGEDTDSAFANVEVRPTVSLIQERGRLVVDGRYSRSEYFQRYGGDEGYGATISGDTQLSAFVTLQGSVSYDSSIVGSNLNAFDEIVFRDPAIDTPVVGGTAPVVTTPVAFQPVLLPGIDTGDINFVGRRQRRNLLQTAVNLSARPDARSTFTVGAFASRARYPGMSVFGSDYRIYGGNAGYSRQLTARSSAGARVSVSSIEYDAIPGDTLVVTPQLTYQLTLSRGWSIDAAAGASINRRSLIGGSDTDVSFSGQISACKRDVRTSLCLNASRATSATGLGDVQQQTSVGASYGYRLDERSNIGAQVGYTRNAGERTSVVPGTFEFFSAGVNFGRQLTERLSLTASASYQDSSQPGFSPDADLTGRVGLAMSFGDGR